MTRINPYLTFNGNCREAMIFYQRCFGGELIMQTVEDSPMADQWPVKARKNILHSSLTKENLVILASDMAGVDGITRGNTISLALVCNDENEIREVFSSLSEKGHVIHPLHEFFDGMIGSLTDRFGMNWILKC